jgi:acyl-CoA thioesterase FadM
MRDLLSQRPIVWLWQAQMGRARLRFTVRVYENSDLRNPYRMVVTRVDGQQVQLHDEMPEWLRALLPLRDPNGNAQKSDGRKTP